MVLNRFSFIVACYNGENFIRLCLESLLNQDYDKTLFEIICVDDGSDDNSPSIIREISEKFRAFHTIRIANSGLEKAVNTGIKVMQYDLVVRVDADDFIDPRFLSIMNKTISQYPDYDFYYCKNYLEYYSEDQQYERELPDFDKEEIFCRGDFFATGTVYRKKALEEIGFFPEDVKNCGLENYYVVLALLSLGKVGLAVPKASFSYRRHSQNMSTIKRNEIIEYGRKLLRRYGRKFQTNPNHPYRLKLKLPSEFAKRPTLFKSKKTE